jgi:hypothetical protein
MEEIRRKKKRIVYTYYSYNLKETGQLGTGLLAKKEIEKICIRI